MKKGFDRLRGVAAASAMGVGLLGGGSARAVTVTIPLSVTVSFTRGGVSWSGLWSGIGNTDFSCMSGQSITTTGGFSLTSGMSCFAISSASLSNTTTSSRSEFYNGGMSLVVGDVAAGHVLFVNPDGDVDLDLDPTGDTLTTDLVMDIIPGIDARIEYYFDPTRAVVRGVYTLTNTSGAEITTSALVMGNYGSGADTTVQATESGDLVVTDADKWVVTDDNGMDLYPTATIASHGGGATVIPKTVMKLGSAAAGASMQPDNYGYRYDLTIPAGATCRIMVFNEMTFTIADAVAGAADFESLADAGLAGLLTGLTMAEQDTIVNYAAGTACTAAVVAPPVVLNNDCCNDNDGIFSLGVPGLLGALGSLLLFRRRDTKNRH